MVILFSKVRRMTIIVYLVNSINFSSWQYQIPDFPHPAWKTLLLTFEFSGSSFSFIESNISFSTPAFEGVEGVPLSPADCCCFLAPVTKLKNLVDDPKWLTSDTKGCKIWQVKPTRFNMVSVFNKVWISLCYFKTKFENKYLSIITSIF